MEQADKDRFSGLIASLCAVFRQEMSAPMLTGYWVGLEDLPFEMVEKAATRCMKACTFMPTIHEIRHHAGPRSLEERAELAWRWLLATVRQFGYNANIRFKDVAITEAVERMGGWENITGRKSDDLLIFGRKEFLGAYKSWLSNATAYEQTMTPRTMLGAHGGGDVLTIKAPYLEPGAIGLPESEDSLVLPPGEDEPKKLDSGDESPHADRIIDAVSDYMDGKQK